MPTKEQILKEIKRTAKENGGAPLGKVRLRKETGISEYDITKYWARFSEAQKEAGFDPNRKQSAHDEDLLLNAFVDFMRRLGHFPTRAEMRVERFSRLDFPPDAVYYRRFGSKENLVNKVVEFAAKKGYDEIVKMSESILESADREEKKDATSASTIGEVYLFKSGRYYKIGKTFDMVRRGKELRIQLPEKMNLIHSIKTDDPSGVEAYWHRRFDTKRMNGEWFDLNSADIKAFKLWKRIY